MALVGGAIVVGGTFGAPSGGTSRTLVDLGGDKSSRRLLVDDSAEFRVRSLINVTNQEPTSNSGYPGGYTPAKRKIAVMKPIVLADGKVFNNQLVIEYIVHPETTGTQIDELRSVGSAVSTDSDFTAFIKTGSLS